MLTPLCYVRGDDPQHAFGVKIGNKESVTDLKEAIKARETPKFDHIPADELVLWKISVPFNQDLKENVEALNLVGDDALQPPDILLDVFPTALAKKSVHIVVDCPPPATPQSSTLQLFCYVRGDDSRRVFGVEIGKAKSVADLKEAIKAKKTPKFDHIPADELDLWNVNIPLDENLKETVDNPGSVDENPLLPFIRLSNVFPQQPADGYLHIVVKAQSTGPSPRSQGAPPSVIKHLLYARQDWIKRFPSRPPSEQGKPKQFASDQRKTIPAFYFNRPPSTAATIPITLFDRIFAQFQEDCEAYAPTREDHAFVLKLSLSMSNFYKDEGQRVQQARADMGTYGLDFQASMINGYITDGDLRWKGFCYALLEYKDEIGAGGAEPLFQAGWYYGAFTRKLCTEDTFSNLPCFILYAFGPYIGFAGAMWTGRPHLQVLAPVLPLFYHHTDVKMRGRAARYFGAAKKAICSLKNYYRYTLPSNRRNLNPVDRPIPVFPYQTKYTPLEDSPTQTFEYICQLETDKLVFRCKGIGGDICVKFVRQYSKDAHLKCSTLGFAPALQGFESLPGGWYMVVMDFVNEKTYELLEDSRFKPSFSTEVRERLASLHQEGYVHGDVRATNIMVKKNGEQGIMLLDFDWAGVVNEIRYPMNVNITEIRRPDGVFDGQLILAEHDMAMIGYIFDSVHQ